MSQAVKESKARSVVKGISWRIVGTADTITIAFLVTGNIRNALTIGGTEIMTKLLLFYLHERAWIHFSKGDMHSHFKSLFKAVTWRLTGTIDTIMISFIIISMGSADADVARTFQRASTIGMIELFTKIVLFYFHERAWLHIGFGKKSIEN